MDDCFRHGIDVSLSNTKPAEYCFAKYHSILRATTLPVALKCLDRAGVDKRIGKFVMPIGATVNMDGTALFVTVASVFIAQMNNMPLNGADYVTIV